MEAFVYCWTDHLMQKLYVGSHKGLIDDGYICSSKPMMEQYNKRPQDFTRQIIAEGEFKNIRRLEEKILDAADAKNNSSFYNMQNGNGEFYASGPFTENHKKNMRGPKPWMIGNQNLKGKISPRKGKNLSEEHKNNMRHPKASNTKHHLVGDRRTEAQKQATEITKLKLKNRPQTKLKCPYCDKIGGTTMYRWHFEKCKKKKN